MKKTQFFREYYYLYFELFRAFLFIMEALNIHKGVQFRL